MHRANTETLHLRLPRDLRRDLDAAAGGEPRRLSALARRALAIGLRAISSTGGPDDRPPPPTAPAGAALRAAA